MNFIETVLVGYIMTTVNVKISFFYIKALSTFFSRTYRKRQNYCMCCLSAAQPWVCHPV